MNLDEKMASVLSYLLWWVTGIVFILLEKENKTVRFHAFQSLFTFLPISIVGGILNWLGRPTVTYDSYYGYAVPVVNEGLVFLQYISWLVYVLGVILWLFLMFKAYNGEKVKLPVVGDMAENQVK